MGNVSPLHADGQGPLVDTAGNGFGAGSIGGISTDLSDILSEAIDMISRNSQRDCSTGSAGMVAEHAAKAYQEQGDLLNAIRFYRQAAQCYAAMGDANHWVKDSERKDILQPYNVDYARVFEILHGI